MTDKLSYQNASDWAKENNIKTTGQWLALSHKNMLPENLPKNPNVAYKNQWQGWSQFLQNGRRAPSKMTATYEECKRWAQDNNIQTAKQWYNLKGKLPASMPTAPEQAFKAVWQSWPEFLGNNTYSGVSIVVKNIVVIGGGVVVRNSNVFGGQAVPQTVPLVPVFRANDHTNKRMVGTRWRPHGNAPCNLFHSRANGCIHLI